MLALITAPVAWAWGSVWSRGRDLAAPFVSTAAQMLCGGVFMAVLAAVLGERIVEVPPLRSTLALVYLTLFGSIVAYSAYVWLLDHVRPALATSYAYINPPIAVLLGAVLLGENVGAHSVAAMVVILAGVLIVMRSKARLGG
jgi:drug/metabolite transporter (DMT)-like permease